MWTMQSATTLRKSKTLKEEHESKREVESTTKKTKTFVPMLKQRIAVRMLAGDVSSNLAALNCVTPAVEN
jgi:hypothetical protein